MALNWMWDEKCGEAVLRQTINGEARNVTLNLYTGNAYLIMIHEWEEKGVEKYNVWSFWVGKDHMKRCLGLEKGTKNIYCGWDKIVKFKLDKTKCRYWKQIVPAVAKAFDDIDIELYTSKKED